MSDDPRSVISDADRFDPPVTRFEWRTSGCERFEQALDPLRQRLTTQALERLLRHRGLQLDGRPVGEDEAGCQVPAGTRVVAWVLARDPVPIDVGSAQVLFDEAGVVAAAKPAWLPVQGTRASQCFSLERALRDLLDCPGLRAVHRLDRETSGVTLFARDAAAASFLGRALAARRVRRSYLAVVAPPPAPDFEVGGEMVRVEDPQRFRFALAPRGTAGGRESQTRFVRLVVEGERALVRAIPATGRTHQIRVHLSAVGSPILGDRLYGEPRAPAAARCLLHARRVELVLPSPGGREVALETSPPEDFSRAGFPGA